MKRNRVPTSPDYAVVTMSALGALNVGFKGQYLDTETGTWNNGFRTYDASLGRYLQSDPIGAAGGLNTFEYARAQPISLDDPLGLHPGALAVAACVGSGLSGYLTVDTVKAGYRDFKAAQAKAKAAQPCPGKTAGDANPALRDGAATVANGSSAFADPIAKLATVAVAFGLGFTPCGAVGMVAGALVGDGSASDKVTKYELMAVDWLKEHE